MTLDPSVVFARANGGGRYTRPAPMRAREVRRSSPDFVSGQTASRSGRIARNKRTGGDEDSPNILASVQYNGNQGCSQVTGGDGAVACGWVTPSHRLGDRIMSWQNWKRVFCVAGVLVLLFLFLLKREADRLQALESKLHLSVPSKGKYTASFGARPGSWSNSLGMKFVRIEPGKFIMGSTEDDDEKPPHLVEITRAFSLGDREVTQRQYQEVMGWLSNPFMGSVDLPVERVSWLDAVTFCNKLSEKERRTPCYRINGEDVAVVVGNGYRLPTEAEWEYSCRAGSTTRFPFGENQEDLYKIAWFARNAGMPGTGPSRLAGWIRTNGISTTCSGTSSNGVRTATTLGIMRCRLGPTLRALRGRRPASSGAGIGATARRTAARRTGAGTLQGAGSAAWASGSPQIGPSRAAPGNGGR